jgi:glycosyltransferase involved in cell wall biosynthesis
LKVLIVHNRYRSGSPGGEDIVVSQEKSLMEAAGFQVRQYLRSNDELRSGGVKSKLSLARDLLVDRFTVEQLHREIASFKPDVVHVHNVFPIIRSSIYEVCLQEGVPLVQTLHNYRLICPVGTHYRERQICTECSSKSRRAAVSHACYKNSRLATLYLSREIERVWDVAVRRSAVSHFMVLTEFAGNWLQREGVPRSRIVLKPNFVPRLDSVTRHREGFAIYVGRLSVEKGIRTLLAAWRLLSDVPLVIVGDGPERSWIETFVAEHDLPISLIGMRSRESTRELIAKASCLVLPSEWFEGMPLTLLEANEAGTPIVASDIGGVSETLQVTVSGSSLLFRPGDPEALSKAVRRILDPSFNHESIKRFGGTELFTPENSLRILQQTYTAAMQRYSR